MPGRCNRDGVGGSRARDGPDMKPGRSQLGCSERSERSERSAGALLERPGAGDGLGDTYTARHFKDNVGRERILYGRRLRVRVTSGDPEDGDEPTHLDSDDRQLRPTG